MAPKIFAIVFADAFPVATFITEIRDDIDHAERKEGLVGTWRRPGITELLALNEQGSRHLIDDDNSATDRLFERLGIGN